MGLWKIKPKSGRGSWPSIGASSSKNTTSTASDDLSVPPAGAQDLHPTAILPAPQTAPLLTLPLELIQQITSYLDRSTAASFCLSSRYICYAVGTAHLTRYLAAAASKFERRKNIEILERAFPSHWYCAWCDRFHALDAGTGPRSFRLETRRNCAEFNSYLHDSWDYVLCYHHVRLAVNRALWGEPYGLGLQAFAHDEQAVRKTRGEHLNTRLRCEARVVAGRFLLHASFRITRRPMHSVYPRSRSVVSALMPMLPHIVAGHRDSHAPHTGLARSLDAALTLLGPSAVQLCSVCATDFQCSTAASRAASGTDPGAFVLDIDVWRDLGAGRNPFDASWRAHGELGSGAAGFASDMWRLTALAPGDIRRAFESGEPGRATDAPRSMGQPSVAMQELGKSWTQEIIRSRATRVAA